MEVKSQTWEYSKVLPEMYWAIPKSCLVRSKLDISLKFVDQQLLTAIFSSRDPTHWQYKSSEITNIGRREFYRNIWPKGEFDLVAAYKFYAYVIRIIGLQNKPTKSIPQKNPEEAAFKEEATKLLLTSFLMLS